MGRADEVEALANALRHHEGTEPAAAVIALREYGALLRRSESDVRFGIGEWSERDTRPRFAGGARAQEDEDRCAPLVAAIARIEREAQENYERLTARVVRENVDYGTTTAYDVAAWKFTAGLAADALRAHRERTGDG